MDFALLVGLLIGFSLALCFGAGAGITHQLERMAFEKRVCGTNTAEEHRIEGERLIHEALRTQHHEYEVYLRGQAYMHFRQADILDNGPYNKVDLENYLR